MRIWALVIRILRQFMRDKRTLALMIVAPMLILSLLWFVFHGDTYKPVIAAVQTPDLFVQKLERQGATVLRLSLEEAEPALEQAAVDAIIRIDPGSPPDIRLEGSDPAVSKAVLMLVRTALQDLSSNTPGAQPAISYLHGSEDMAAFDNFGPVLIGFFSFFFVFLVSGVSFLRERTGGTLERLLATPLRRWEIVAGYIAGFGLFTMIQAALIAWYAIDVLGMMMNGSFWYVLLITLLLSMTALTLGILLSAFAANEFQMIQFIPLVIVPQIFFSGLFRLDAMADWLRWIASAMPLTYGAEALREVMIRGKGWQDIALDVYALLAFSAAFVTLNTIALKKHRRI